MVNFGLLAAEICWRVWGTPANFNGFRVLAVLLRGTRAVGTSQTLRRWAQGATYIRALAHILVLFTFYVSWRCILALCASLDEAVEHWTRTEI